MYKLEVSRQFLKDLKLARKRNLNETKLNDVIKLLMNGEQLPFRNKDHALSGNYQGWRECHITPDWLLIYSKEETARLIRLLRTGTHSDLF